MRRFIVGDIHGGYRGLIQVLDRVKFNYDNDMLISLGDVTDGWSETAECIELLLKVKNLIYIKGNHDEWTSRYLKSTLTTGLTAFNHHWLFQGGGETYNSYKKYPELVDKHLEFLDKAKLYHIDDDNRIYLHAGFNPDIDLDMQEFVNVGQANHKENALFYWDRMFWRTISNTKSNTKPTIWERYNEIYIGHTPTNRTKKFKDGLPANIGNVWNMDTGAAYDGKISIMNIDTKEITQSDALYKLYPEEKGRNGEYLGKNKNKR